MAILVKSTTAKEDKNFWASNWFCFYDAEMLYGRRFKLDVAAEYLPVMAVSDGVIRSDTVTTAKVPNFFMLPWADALENEWIDDWYCNPPFDDKLRFIQKAVFEATIMGHSGLMLLPHEPLTDWWIENVEPYADTIYLPDGRYPFYERDGYTKKDGVNFGSCFVLFTPHAGNGQPRQARFERTMQGPAGKAQLKPPAGLSEYLSWSSNLAFELNRRKALNKAAG